MATNTIIPASLLAEEVEPDALTADLEKAVKRGSNFVNNNAKKYIQFDNYNTGDESTNAPEQIVEICLEISKIYYDEIIGRVSADDQAKVSRLARIEMLKDDLKNIDITPEWIEQTITLDSNDVALLGTRSATTFNYPRVIPFTAQVVDTANPDVVYVQGEDADFIIRRGYDTDENRDAWYIKAITDIDGFSVKFMKSFKKNNDDYMEYKNI